MLPSTTTFVASRILIHSSFNFLRQTSFVPLPPKHVRVRTSPRLPTLRKPLTTLNMRNPRNRPSSPSPISRKPFEKLLGNVAYIWRTASSSERLTIGTATVASVALIGLMLNALLHISLFLAFSLVPLLLIPLMFAFIASFTAFAFIAFATAGAGALFVGTPLFALSLIAKAFIPTIFVSAGIALLVRHLLGFKNGHSLEQPPESIEDVDDLERFDRILRNRQTQKSIDVSRWNINDVIDELDYVGLGAYRQLFIEERIDGLALLDLTYDEIRTEFAKSMPLGDRMRLTRLVTVLRKQSNKLQ